MHKHEFQKLDINMGGTVSKEELLAMYMKVMKNSEARNAVDRIMQDSDMSGYINYSEFLKACMHYDKYMSEENLMLAFKMFDKDGSGDISVDEIKRIFNGVHLEDDHLWRKIIDDVDSNGDGLIDLKEFIGLMTSGGGTS